MRSSAELDYSKTLKRGSPAVITSSSPVVSGLGALHPQSTAIRAIGIPFHSGINTAIFGLLDTNLPVFDNVWFGSSTITFPQMSARFLARSIILSRSPISAFLLSFSRSAGIDANADSIAMSFASAKLTFINCNSCSILSNVRFDKSFSESVSGGNYKEFALRKQRRSRRITVAASNRPTA